MNKHYFRLLFLFVGLSVFVSCENDELEVKKTEVTVEHSTININPTEGSTASVTCTSSAAWTITLDDEWFSISEVSGEAGEFTLTVTAEQDNPSIEKVMSKFTICAEEKRIPVTVVHLGEAIEISTSTDSIDFDAAGVQTSTGALTVTSNAAWVASTSDAWIHLTDTAGEASDDAQTLAFTVDPNASVNAQVGQIKVEVPGNEPILISINQAGAAFSNEIDTASINGITLGGAGAQAKIYIKTNTDWTITTTESWITVAPASGVASNDSTEVTIALESNPDFAAGRSGSITLNYAGFESAAQTFTISQAKGEQPKDAITILNMLPTLKGAGTFAPNWDLNVNANTWEGLTFESGRLTKIELSNKGLAGVIPADMDTFPELVTLDLSANNLTGNIPAKIGKLTKLTTFKVAMNQLAGTVPCAIVRENYPKWSAMTNVYPQQGSTDTIIPKNLQLKLESVGILRAMYWHLDGPNWVRTDGSTEPNEWLHNDDVVLAGGMFAVGRIGGTGALQAFDKVKGLSGVVPAEAGMDASLAQFRVNTTATEPGGITGKLPKGLLGNVKYLLVNNHDIEMDFEELLNSVNIGAIVEIQVAGNKISSTNGIPEKILEAAKLSKNSNISNNGMSGEISAAVKAFLVGKLTDEARFTTQIMTGNNFTIEGE